VSNGALDQQTQQKAAELAHRLRLLQVDLAEHPSSERQDHMVEALERGLAGLTPENRRAVVDALADRFPSWDSNVQFGAAATGAPAVSVMDSSEVRDPSFLLARLIEVSRGMTPGQKESAAGELKKAGFALHGDAGLPEVPAKALHAALGLSARDHLDAGRVTELATMLASVAILLDNIVPAVWGRLAPTSGTRKTATLKTVLPRFASGDKETVRLQVDGDAETLRRITSGMIGAIKAAAGRFAREYLQRLDPAAIEQEVRSRGRFNIDGNCWKEYQQRAGAVDADALEREFISIFVTEAERLMKVGR